MSYNLLNVYGLNRSSLNFELIHIKFNYRRVGHQMKNTN